MTIWTETHIQTLVPDASALRDGQRLAASANWSGLGRHEAAAWGLAQGSAKDPYKVCVELDGGAAKCTCPSRRFPCKHAIAIMFLLIRSELPRLDSAPDWVTSWLDGRQRRQDIAVAAAKPVDAAAQAKREAARVAKVEAGIEELRLFLEDLARSGLEDPRVKTYEFWDRIAARMVDAQMGPVASRLRALGGKPFRKRQDWASQVAGEIGRLYALTEAFHHLDSLPDGLRHDVRTALGFAIKHDNVLASQPAVRDRWHVVGQAGGVNEKVVERRTWLYGAQSERYALILDFAHTSRPFTLVYPIGYSFDAALAFYPSAYPLRAVVKGADPSFRPDARVAAFASATVSDILDRFAEALALNPFLERIPGGLPRAYPTRNALIDPTGMSLPVVDAPSAHWLRAVVGGNWVSVFGEWDGEGFLMTTIATAEGWHPAKTG